MSEATKILAFVAFCVESYKHRKGLEGMAAADVFRRYGVDKYLTDEYEVLHTMGMEQILDDIERFIEVREVGR